MSTKCREIGCAPIRVGQRAQHCTGWVGPGSTGDPCHQTFSGTSLGDAHRVGDITDGTRRCLSVEEMADRGWHRSDNGVWHWPAPEGGFPDVEPWGAA